MIVVAIQIADELYRMSFHRMQCPCGMLQVSLIRGEVAAEEKPELSCGLHMAPVGGDEPVKCSVDSGVLLNWAFSVNGQHVCYHTENRSGVCQFNA